MNPCTVPADVALDAILSHHKPSGTVALLAGIPMDLKLALDPIDLWVAVGIGYACKI